MRKMKILVVGPSPIKSKGGMATVIKGISEDKTLADDFDITIFDSFIDGNIIVRLLYSIFAYFKFIIMFKKYDLFHVHMASNGSTFRKAYYIRTLKRHNKRVIVHIHGAGYLAFYNKLNNRRKESVVKTINMADIIIALSEEWKLKLELELGIQNILVLNNGIDTEPFSHAVNNVLLTRGCFLFLGRLGERKGTYDLVEAITQIRDAGVKITCYMAGDGDVEKIQSIVKERKLEDYIKVVGWVDFNEKVELLKKVGTVVLPSYNEGLPMALLEGMAAGKIVISSNVGAIPELVTQGKNGYIINPGDITALKDAMYNVIYKEDSLSIISENNINKINADFSRKKMHRILAGYYRKLEKKVEVKCRME